MEKKKYITPVRDKFSIQLELFYREVLSRTDVMN